MVSCENTEFKIATVMHAILYQRGPTYRCNIVKFNSKICGQCQLLFVCN